MNKGLSFANLALALATVLGGVWYTASGYALGPKSVASAMFVLLGVVNLVPAWRSKAPTRAFALVMCVGLAVAALADVVLELNFLGGAIIFAVGHVFYFLAYTRLLPLQRRDLLPGGLLFAVTGGVILFLPVFTFEGPMQVVCLVYALIISAMLGKAFANVRRRPSLLTKLLLLGSALFFFSDLMLLLRHFAGAPAICSAFCVNTYYPAQAILAYAVGRNGEKT